MEYRDALVRVGVFQFEHPLLTPLALAEARLGHLELALQHIERVIALLRAEAGGGVLLGQAFEVAAEIAVCAGDHDAFDRHAQACESQYRAGGHAPLLARVERLQRRARAVNAARPDDPGLVEISNWVRSANDALERAERALHAIASACHCDTALLYLLTPMGLALVAHSRARTSRRS